MLKRKNNTHPIDLYGFEIDDEWAVGYGLDDNGLRRNENNIYEKLFRNDRVYSLYVIGVNLCHAC